MGSKSTKMWLNSMTYPVPLRFHQSLRYDGPPYNAGSPDILGELLLPEDGMYIVRLVVYSGTRNDQMSIAADSQTAARLRHCGWYVWNFEMGITLSPNPLPCGMAGPCHWKSWSFVEMGLRVEPILTRESARRGHCAGFIMVRVKAAA